MIKRVISIVAVSLYLAGCVSSATTWTRGVTVGSVKMAAADRLVTDMLTGERPQDHTFSVNEKTVLKKSGQAISPTDLQPGDMVLVRYSGEPATGTPVATFVLSIIPVSPPWPPRSWPSGRVYAWRPGSPDVPPARLQIDHLACAVQTLGVYAPIVMGTGGIAVKRTVYKDCMEKFGWVKAGELEAGYMSFRGAELAPSEGAGTPAR